MITADRLREVLHYDPETGVFRWLKTGKGRRFNEPIGSLDRHGHLRVTIFARQWQTHRLAWLYMTGEMPPADIDHINGIRADNRWTNLRKASRSQNNANAKRRSDNVSGLKGVAWDAARKKWRAQIKMHGRYQQLGRFDDRNAAHAAYVAKARELFGPFARSE